VNWDAIISVVLKILAVLALVLLNGFFVAAEFALVRIRETQLDILVAKGWRRAKMAQHIVHNLNSYLSATQLGITMVSLGRWFHRPDVSAHHGGRTRAEMADDSKTVARRVGGGVSVALVLPGVLSIQPVAESLGPLAFGKNRH
jgi:CBS domain containing-hemolysin-like protein